MNPVRIKDIKVGDAVMIDGLDNSTSWDRVTGIVEDNKNIRLEFATGETVLLNKEAKANCIEAGIPLINIVRKVS